MEVIYHDEVKRFIKSLQKSTGEKIVRSIDLLEKYGRALGMPQTRFVVDGIYELRIRGQQEVRVFFIFYQNRAYLLHGFVKKTQKTPRRELEIAKKRRLT